MNRKERIAQEKALSQQAETHARLMRKALEAIKQVPTCDFESKEAYEAAIGTVQFWRDKLTEMVILATTTLNQIEREKQELKSKKGIHDEQPPQF